MNVFFGILTDLCHSCVMVCSCSGRVGCNDLAAPAAAGGDGGSGGGGVIR